MLFTAFTYIFPSVIKNPQNDSTSYVICLLLRKRYPSYSRAGKLIHKLILNSFNKIISLQEHKH